jgi:hypothetical protein
MWLHATLPALSRFGLARIDHEAFRIHRLTQAVLRDQVDAADVEAVHDDAAAVLAAVVPGEAERPENRPTWASLTSHLTARRIDVAARHELWPALREAVHFLLRSGQPRSALDLATQLLASWTALLGPDHPDVLTCRQYQGHATADLGDLRGAPPIIEHALVRQRRILGDDHQDVRRTTKALAARRGVFVDSAARAARERRSAQQRRPSPERTHLRPRG